MCSCDLQMCLLWNSTAKLVWYPECEQCMGDFLLEPAPDHQSQQFTVWHIAANDPIQVQISVLCRPQQSKLRGVSAAVLTVPWQRALLSSPCRDSRLLQQVAYPINLARLIENASVAL